MQAFESSQSAATVQQPGTPVATQRWVVVSHVSVVHAFPSLQAESALQQVAQGLVIPPLAPLTTEHVLARAFYLLQDFPGRYTGASVWVQRDQDRANDSVSPIIIGGNDWASAWAIDDSGRNPYAVIPGGSRQRTLAYRFGVNLVMYALTGNYKGDQVHVPAILQRLGQ